MDFKLFINEFKSNFDIKKALWKFFLGALTTALIILIKDPFYIVKIIPNEWFTLILGGLVLEILDYTAHIIDKTRK